MVTVTLKLSVRTLKPSSVTGGTLLAQHCCTAAPVHSLNVSVRDISLPSDFTSLPSPLSPSLFLHRPDVPSPLPPLSVEKS